MDELLTIFSLFDVLDLQEIDQNHLDVTYENQQKDYPNVFYNLPIGAYIVNHAKQYVDELICKILGNQFSFTVKGLRYDS